MVARRCSRRLATIGAGLADGRSSAQTRTSGLPGVKQGLHPAIYAAIPRRRCPGGSAVIEMRQAQLETASSVMSVTAALTAGL